MEDAPPFDRHGPAEPTSPVVLSVPHAGRDYPLALRAALQVPIAQLTVLEDRAVDCVALATRVGQTTFVQRRARAWIDLNRAEPEPDPPFHPGGAPAQHTALSAKTGRSSRMGAMSTAIYNQSV